MAQRRILIAHPSDPISQTLAGALSRAPGFTAKVVHDGFETAVELLAGEVDSLVLHTQTPGLSPSSVIRFLRARSKKKQLPILILLPRYDVTLLRRFKRDGATESLSEPVLPTDLVRVVAKLHGLATEPVKKRQAPPPGPKAQPAPRPADSDGVKLKGGPAAGDPWTQGPKVVRKRLPDIATSLVDQIWDRTQKGGPIPGLPAGGSRLDTALGDIFGDLVAKDVVAADLAMAVGILRMSNSIEHRGIEPIAGLSRALLRVGQRQVAKYFSDTHRLRKEIPKRTRAFLLESFTRHSLMVACLSEMIAGHVRYRDSDAVFSAGLLHDVGRLFLVHEFGHAYADVENRVLEAKVEPGTLLDVCAIERKVLKIDHGLVGYELCGAWRLPGQIIAGTLHHQLDHERAMKHADAIVAVIVALADSLERVMERDRAQETAGYSAAGGAPSATISDHMALVEFYGIAHGGMPEWVRNILGARVAPLRYIFEKATARVDKVARRAGLEAA